MHALGDSVSPAMEYSAEKISYFDRQGTCCRSQDVHLCRDAERRWDQPPLERTLERVNGGDGRHFDDAVIAAAG